MAFLTTYNCLEDFFGLTKKSHFFLRHPIKSEMKMRLCKEILKVPDSWTPVWSWALSVHAHIESLKGLVEGGSVGRFFFSNRFFLGWWTHIKQASGRLWLQMSTAGSRCCPIVAAAKGCIVGNPKLKITSLCAWTAWNFPVFQCWGNGGFQKKAMK